MTQEELELESWGDKCQRLARELKALKCDPFGFRSQSARQKYAAKRYELLQHLETAE